MILPDKYLLLKDSLIGISPLILDIIENILLNFGIFTL